MPDELNLEIFDKLDLERKPVGVKFSYLKPMGFEKLEKELYLCEFAGEAQRTGRPFYIDKENEVCYGKKFLEWKASQRSLKVV
jgi:uncharacterized protein (DUF169 family)